MSDINQYNEKIFESIKHVNEYGQEYWNARELSNILEYTEFNKFEPVIKKAMIACQNSDNMISDHFAEVSEMAEHNNSLAEAAEMADISNPIDYAIFQNLDEKLDKLFEWELISKAAKKKELKFFKYYFTKNKSAFDECDIVGYIPYPKNNGETAVVSVKSNLCKIMPAYLKQMQLLSFENIISNTVI